MHISLSLTHIDTSTQTSLNFLLDRTIFLVPLHDIIVWRLLIDVASFFLYDYHMQISLSLTHIDTRTQTSLFFLLHRTIFLVPLHDIIVWRLLINVASFFLYVFFLKPFVCYLNFGPIQHKLGRPSRSSKLHLLKHLHIILFLLHSIWVVTKTSNSNKNICLK